MKRATVMMISKVKQGKVFSLVLLLAMLLSACGNDRGSDGILRSVVRIKLELLPDEREYRDLHADIFVDGNLVGSVENGSSEILKLPVGLRSIKLSLEGFKPVEKKVEVLEDSAQTFNFTLQHS